MMFSFSNEKRNSTIPQWTIFLAQERYYNNPSFPQAITLKYTQSHTLVSEKKCQILNPHYNFSQFGNELSQIVLT